MGATAIRTSGSSAPTSTIAPSLPSGLLAQITSGSRSRSAWNRPSASAVTANGNGVHVVRRRSRPSPRRSPCSAAPATTTRPVSVPFSGRGIRKSRTSSVSSLTVIFSFPVRGGPMIGVGAGTDADGIMARGVGHLAELPPDLRARAVPLFMQVFRGLASGLVEPDELVGCGPVAGADGDSPADDRPPAELEVDSVDRLPLADDDVEARRRGPVLVVDVDGVGLARVDVHLIRPVGGRAGLAWPLSIP